MKTRSLRLQLKPGDVGVRIDPKYFRPTEVEFLLGDASKAREKLGWEAVVSSDELVKLMIEEDLKEAKKDYLNEVVGFKGKIVYLTNMPNGTARKLLDVFLSNAMGWRAS